jgi:hypothetical protein
MIIIKTLIALVGVLIAGGGMAAAWYATGSSDDITKIEAEIYKQRSDNAFRRAGEAGEKKIADMEQQIKEKETERNIRFGVAGAGLIVGLGMALVPWVGKRKTFAARPAPAPDQGAPSL